MLSQQNYLTYIQSGLNFSVIVSPNVLDSWFFDPEFNQVSHQFGCYISLFSSTASSLLDITHFENLDSSVWSGFDFCQMFPTSFIESLPWHLIRGLVRSQCPITSRAKHDEMQTGETARSLHCKAPYVMCKSPVQSCEHPLPCRLPPHESSHSSMVVASVGSYNESHKTVLFWSYNLVHIYWLIIFCKAEFFFSLLWESLCSYDV